MRELPNRIHRLNELAGDLWWSWNRTARVVFRRLDYPLWRSTAHNPVKMLGLISNDALARVPVSEFAQTVSRTLKWLKATNVDVVLVGMQYTKKVAKDAHYKLIKDALKQVAQEENVALVKRYDAMQYMEETRAKMTFITADDLHLNDLGYRCMAEYAARAIVAGIVQADIENTPVR